MGEVFKITNKIDNKQYQVSVISTNRRISVPQERYGFPGVRDMIDSHVIYQASIYSANKIPYKPLFVINCTEAVEWISGEEFSSSVREIILNEGVNGLINNNYEIYSKYGFLSYEWDFWSLFAFSKIKNIFVMNDVIRQSKNEDPR